MSASVSAVAPSDARCRVCGLRECVEGDHAPRGSEAVDGEPLFRDEFGPYRPVRVLGRGAFSTVFEAVADGEARPVALKVAAANDAEAVRMLAREGDMLATLALDVVPRLRGRGTSRGGAPFLALERIDGPTLAVRLAHTSPGRGIVERRGDLLAVFSAVAELHRRGWIHGDLKPENIVIGGPSGVTLLDFGLARRVDAQSPEDRGSQPGTVEYMSPEQCTSGAAIDGRSDVYALGVLLYEVVFGHPPFVGRDEEVREAHRSGRVPLMDKRGAMSRLILACLAKSPEDRPASVEVLREVFRHASDPTARGVEPQVVRAPLPPEAAWAADRYESVATLFFQSARTVDGLLGVLQSEGGQIVDLREDRRVVAFRAVERENPALVALRTAERLLRKGIASTLIVDVVVARVRTRSSLGPRLSSPAFLEGARFPARSLGTGVFVTDAARARLLSYRFEAASGTRLWRTVAHDTTTESEPPLSAMVGRATLLQSILASTQEASAGSPVLCTVVGEAGIGKTRLAQAAHSALRKRGQWATVRLTPTEPLGSAPRVVTPELVGELLGLGRPVTIDDGELVIAWMGEEFMQQHGLGLSFALGWIGPEDPRLAKFKTAPGALQSMGALAVGECLRQVSRLHPTAIFLDNAQYADQLLLAAIGYATRSENSGVLWVCVLGRKGFLEAAQRRGWAAATPIVHGFEVDALPPGEAQELVRVLLEPISHPPIWLLEQIAARAGGHPLLLGELVEGLKRAGLVRPAERGSGVVFAPEVLAGIPQLPLVEWLISRELERLPEDLRTFAGLAAAMGPEFEADELVGVVEVLESLGVPLPSRLDPRMGLLRLVGARILRARGSHYLFRHEALRQRLDADVSGALRSAWHRAAYSYFQTLASQGRTYGVLLHLAHHASRAGLRANALEHHLALGEIAESRHAYHEAEASYGQALEFCPQGSPLRRLAWHRRGVLRYRLGLYESATEALDTALELAQQFGEVAAEVAILLDAATVWDWREDHALSSTLVDKAADMAEMVQTPLLEARLTLARGRTCFRRSGDADKACELLLDAAAKAEKLGHEGYETRVIAMLIAGPVLAYRGQVELAKALFERLIVLCEEHNDAMHLATAYNNRAALWDALQDEVRTLGDLERVVEQSRTYGFATLEAMALRNAAEIYYVTSRYQESLKRVRASIELGRKIVGEGHRVQVSLLTQARIHAISDDGPRAAEVLAEVRHNQIQSQGSGRSDTEFIPGDKILCRMVELFVARASAEEWRELVAAAEGETMQSERVELLEFAALAALARGDRAEAKLHLEQAVALLERHPMMIAHRIRQRLQALNAGRDPWPERTSHT